MLFSFSPSFVGTSDTEVIQVEELVIDTLPFIFAQDESGLSFLCMHRSLPGEHVDSHACWCEPEEMIFGVQPFFAEA